MDSACSILSRMCCSLAQVRSSFPSEIPSCDDTEVKAKICKSTKVKSDVVLWAWGRGVLDLHECCFISSCIFPKRHDKRSWAVSFLLFAVLNIHELNF